MRAMLLILSSLFCSGVFASPQIQIETGAHEPVVSLQNRDQVAGIVAAGSTFTDLTVTETTQRATVDTVGSASLVRLEKNGHLAVLTAAHVVGGVRPWVEVSGKRIYPKEFLIDNDHDIAVLDLGINKASEAISFGKDGLKMSKTFAKAIDAGQVPIVMIAYYYPAHALAFALRPWVDPGVESAYTRSIVHAPIVSMSENGEMVRVYTKITSGASGSAVFDLREKSVAGLVVQSHYYFSETYLVAPSVLNVALNLFVSGKRGSLTKTEWRMRNCLAYRVYEDGTAEANFGTHAVSGIIGQPGSGIIGQPGSGIIGQPSNGVIGQPGSGIIGQPTNGVIGQPGNGVIGQPDAAHKEFLPWTQDPRAVFEYFKIQPGMIWKNQPIIGFRITKLENAATEFATWPKTSLLFGEMEGVRFLREHARDFKVEAIAPEANYVSLLQERLGIPAQAKTVRLKTLFGPNAVADDVELARRASDSYTEITADGRIHVKVQTYARMNRATWILEPDVIEFTLEANGAPKGESHFLPVIETKGQKTGETYFVDLRQFFFVDYSQLAQPMKDWSPENPPFDSTRFDLGTQMKTIGFSVRNASSGAEFTYGFSKE